MIGRERERFDSTKRAIALLVICSSKRNPLLNDPLIVAFFDSVVSHTQKNVQVRFPDGCELTCSQARCEVLELTTYVRKLVVANDDFEIEVSPLFFSLPSFLRTQR